MSSIQFENGVPNLYPNSEESLSAYELIDVRQPEEFVGELGHIPGAKLISLGPELEEFLQHHSKKSKILFICRSGARSTHATLMAKELGYEDVTNLAGGMIRWNDLKLKTEH
jgi:rhodanese-related sulfurtransferase